MWRHDCAPAKRWQGFRRHLQPSVAAIERPAAIGKFHPVIYRVPPRARAVFGIARQFPMSNQAFGGGKADSKPKRRGGDKGRYFHLPTAYTVSSLRRKIVPSLMAGVE